jgi:uncharacterized membrane protein
MTNLVVLSFSNEAKAIDASHKLAELESYGDISIFEKAMIKKTANGELVTVQTDTSDGLRIVSGMTLGTLIGAIGGPVGMLIGLLSGTVVGALAETDYVDFSDDFVSNVSKRIQPGNVAILAEVSEDSPAFIDNAMTAFGAVIFRSNVDDMREEYDDKQLKELDDDIAAERKQLKTSMANRKAEVEKKIAQLKEKRKQRIAALKENARSRRKARIEKSISNQKEKISKLEGDLRKLEHS